MKAKSCISKEKIQVIVKENWKSKKVPAFTKGKENLREKTFKSLQSGSLYAVSKGNKK